MDVMPSDQMRLRTMAFSRVSPGDSDIPSSCEMNDEPAFKALQGKPAFFWVRVCRGPFYLRQKTQSRSHITISEGRLLLRCLWKAGLPFQSKTGNLSHLQTIWRARKFPQAALMKLMILYTWNSFLRESLKFPKGSQATCSVWWGSRDGYGAKAREIGLISIWFGAHWFFCFPEVTSRFLSSFDTVAADSLEFNQANRGSLCVWLGKRNCFACNAGESGLISWRVGSPMCFLDLRQAPGVYSRVTTGMPILSGSLFSEVRTPV